MDYKKFYWLEEYLFDEVGPKFRKTGDLDALDFYAILHWKAARAKSRQLARLTTNGPLDIVVRSLAVELFKVQPQQKLELLMKKPLGVSASDSFGHLVCAVPRRVHYLRLASS